MRQVLWSSQWNVSCDAGYFRIRWTIGVAFPHLNSQGQGYSKRGKDAGNEHACQHQQSPSTPPRFTKLSAAPSKLSCNPKCYLVSILLKLLQVAVDSSWRYLYQTRVLRSSTSQGSFGENQPWDLIIRQFELNNTSFIDDNMRFLVEERKQDSASYIRSNVWQHLICWHAT